MQKFRCRWMILCVACLFIACGGEGDQIGPDGSTNRATVGVEGDDKSDSASSYEEPYLVVEGSFAQITAGLEYACALDQEGQASCWSSTVKWWEENRVAKTFKQLSSGGVHVCGILDDDTVHCWGRAESRFSPVPQDQKFKHISSGEWHVCAVNMDDTLQCWGNHDFADVIPEDTQFKYVSAGNLLQCAIRMDDTVVCFNESEAFEVNPERKYKRVSSGRYSACGIAMDDTVDCWRGRYQEQLISPDGRFKQISLSRTDEEACGIRVDDTVECWLAADEDYYNFTLGSPQGEYRQVDVRSGKVCLLDLEGTVSCASYNYERVTSVTE